MLETAPFPPPAALTERKRWGESLKRLLPREDYTESHLLILVLLTCAGSRHLLPTGLSWHRAGYRQTVSSGVLVFGVDAAQQGLASAVPALSPPTLQSPPDPHTPALRLGGGVGIISFGPRGPKSCLHPSTHFPHKDNRDYQGSGEVMTGTDPHQGERFRSLEHRPQFSSCPQQGALLLTHRRFSISSLPPGSCFPTTNYRLCCIYMSFHPAVIPLMCHSLRPSTAPDIC